MLRMDTNEKNAAARRLYARLGYREADIVPCAFNSIPNVRLVLAARTEPDGPCQKLMFCFSFSVVLFFAHISILPRFMWLRHPFYLFPVCVDSRHILARNFATRSV